MQVSNGNSSFVPGQALKATASVLPFGHHDVCDIVVGIDTLSDVNLAVRDLLSDVHAIDLDLVRGTSGMTPFAEEGTLFVWHEGIVIPIPALVARESHLPRDCQALFGVPAIKDLGILLDEQKLNQGHHLCCFLGEKHLRTWWEANEGESVDTRPFYVSSIDVNPQLLPEVLVRVSEIIQKFAKGFEGSANTLPKPFDTEPVERTFKPNAVPQSIPEPKWSYAYGKIVEKWATDGLANGSLEPSQSQWASRAHIVLKLPSGKTANDVDVKVE